MFWGVWGLWGEDTRIAEQEKARGISQRDLQFKPDSGQQCLPALGLNARTTGQRRASFGSITVNGEGSSGALYGAQGAPGAPLPVQDIIPVSSYQPNPNMALEIDSFCSLRQSYSVEMPTAQLGQMNVWVSRVAI